MGGNMKKLWYTFLAFFPLIDVIVSVVLMIVSMVLMVTIATGSVDASAALPGVLLWISIAGIILGIIFCIWGAVVFTVHAKNNEKLTGNAKGIWIGSFVTLICFAFPVYWWKCIRKS